MNRITQGLLLSFLIIIAVACSKNKQSSFGIVIDEQSYKNARAEVDEYAKAIENQGLKACIIVDKWKHPDSIKVYLKTLYLKKKQPLEGVVFIGDIPIPMLRDAQHLSTAFKMDQERYAWNRSSIPSDRFYDDFDLDFQYLKQDSVKKLYHYYSLKPESKQQLTVDIYSARIKPPEGANKYDLLKAYLKKVVDYKKNPVKVDQVMYFTGHGYNSECPRTWMDEKLALSQQFDYLNSQKNYLEYINFQFEEHIKFKLLAELKRKDLDIALLHHHGGPNAQYLDGTPETRSVQDEIWDIKYYLRSKLRSAGEDPKKISKTREDYQKSLGVPALWFEGTFDKEQIEKDSIYNANLDIYTEDHKNYSSNARFIMLDACFTGSFHLNKYLSGEYIFDEGQTITVQANSVNVFQDKWSDEMAGLLGLGMRVGFWHQMNCSLETHLIGDPTLSFVAIDTKQDINHDIVTRKKDMSFWEKQLKSRYADVQALALRMIYEEKGAQCSDLLIDHFKKSTYYTVRAEAFKLLSELRDKNYIEAINFGINDSYELIQRLSAMAMGDTGDESHIPYLVDALLRNNISKRVEYNLKNSANVFDRSLLLAEINKQISEKEFILDKGKFKEELTKQIEYGCTRTKVYVDEILNKESKDKERIFNLRTFRNQNVHPYLESLVQYIDTTKNNDIKLIGIEMLGWFDSSSKRQTIIDFCDREIKDEGLSIVCRNELIKTRNRVK